jgi:WD40 repeat protein
MSQLEETKDRWRQKTPAGEIDIDAPKSKNWLGMTIKPKHLKESRWSRSKRLKDEVMRQDLERFLMEIEERHSWVAYELNDINFLRMKRAEIAAAIVRVETSKIKSLQFKLSQETGLSFFRGNIVSNKRPQNSAAKHLDFSGHIAPINSCKLSKCLQYILSCSTDKTARLWLVKTGKTVLTYSGHSKKVNDCDFHPDFQFNQRLSCIVTCSGDSTIRFWNSHTEHTVKILEGHTEPVYGICFSPNGHSIVSCSEDCSVRTWSFPEGFQLYVFSGHTAPVSTVQFSPSGR